MKGSTVLDLSKVPPGFDLLEALSKGFQSLGDGYIGERKKDEEDMYGKKVAFRVVQSMEDTTQRRLVGTFHRGEYGTQKGIVDTATGLVRFTQLPDYADESPLHFFIYVPTGKSYAILLSQKDRNLGSQAILKMLITTFVRANGCQRKVHIETMLPKKYVDQLLSKSAKEIRIKTKTIDNASRKKIDPENQLVEYQSKIIIKAPKEKVLPKSVIDHFFSEKGAAIFEGEAPFEEVTIAFDLGDKKERTYRLGSNEFSYPVIDIKSPSVSDGYVSQEFFNKESIKIAEMLYEELFGSEE